MQKVWEVIKAVLASFKETILKTAKAWVALAVAAGVTWLAQKGIVIPPETSEAVVLAITGLLTAFFVWLVPNR